mmetsp:Transcript_21706/g.33988  ORF Transcript_21706/g.33988 Transcript_21706/m.33988 type:complete len:126 (-) Transcript_21706:994-1371(-)
MLAFLQTIPLEYVEVARLRAKVVMVLLTADLSLTNVNDADPMRQPRRRISTPSQPRTTVTLAGKCVTLDFLLTSAPIVSHLQMKVSGTLVVEDVMGCLGSSEGKPSTNVGFVAGTDARAQIAKAW